MHGVESRRWLAAYVTESKHPDRKPEMRFSGVLPSGLRVYGATREEVESRVREAVTEATPHRELYS